MATSVSPEIRESRKQDSLCVTCGKTPPREGILNCDSCADKWNRYSKEHSARYRSEGRCSCGNPAAPGKKTCQKCLDGKKEWSEARRINGECLKCGSPVFGKRVYCFEHLLQRRLSDLRKVGVSFEEQERARTAVKSFDGKCEICETQIPGGRGEWCIDHDHSSKKFRGILCHNCNAVLGHARDTEKFLLSAVAYLQRLK